MTDRPLPKVWVKESEIKCRADGDLYVGPFSCECIFMGFQLDDGTRVPFGYQKPVIVRPPSKL